jgi:hypothetical protein
LSGDGAETVGFEEKFYNVTDGGGNPKDGDNSFTHEPDTGKPWHRRGKSSPDPRAFVAVPADRPEAAAR